MSDAGEALVADWTENEKRLRDAGVLVPDKLPPSFKAVVDGLTPEEVDVIIAVNKRLAEAGRVARIKPRDDGLPGYVHIMMPP